MNNKILASGVFLFCMLLISFSAHAINFTPEETYNSVVVVYTNTGFGSGFCIKENLLITNAHVVGSRKNVAVKMYKGNTIQGTVIKTDTDKDLALITTNETLIPLNLTKDSISIGQEVYAIGAPKDMPYTMTKGIISALDRNLGDNSYIQIDASVNSGNSGGPLVDENGNVIGIITLKVSDAEGIGFAINTNDIESFVENTETIAVPSEENTEFQTDNQTENDEINLKLQNITSENNCLKITVCILIFTNIVLVLLYLQLLSQKKQNKKDEFDFEIEIEE